MDAETHRRRYVTNMAQLFAGVHQCAVESRPVCKACWSRAGMTYDQLRTRRPVGAA